jgi:hypothetical protein
MPSSKRRSDPSTSVRHGFYAQAFRAGELADLDAILTEGLANEITMLRIATRRVIDFISDFETRLATLLRTQKFLEGSETNTAAALSTALAEVVKELGIHA